MAAGVNALCLDVGGVKPRSNGGTIGVVQVAPPVRYRRAFGSVRSKANLVHAERSLRAHSSFVPWLSIKRTTGWANAWSPPSHHNPVLQFS